jgi:hypothetical protein
MADDPRPAANPEGTTMSTALRLFRQAAPAPSPPVRHRCACGGIAGPAGHCAECAARARQGLPQASHPGETHEAEAERVAQRVMAGPAPAAAPAQPPPRAAASRGGGAPLPPALRGFFEPRLGQNLGHVRLHADATAASEARALRARAFTRGADISFAAGQYDPDSAAGQRLLAHELAHTLQQSGAPSFRAATPGLPQRAPDPDAPITPPSAPQAPRLQGMLAHLQEWSAAGLLDPPFRPATVGAIPPLPVSQKTAAKLGLNTQQGPSLAGAAPALATAAAVAKVAEPIVTATRPVLTVIEGGEVVAAMKPVPAPAGGALRFLGPLAIGLTVFLWPSETAPPWLDELNPITGEPYGSPEEYRWVRRLTPEQQDYLRRLDRAEREEPDPTLEAERDPEAPPAPTTTLAPGPELGPFAPPQPQPQPEPDKDRRPPCIAFDVPRRGGHKLHDAYADKVTKSPFDYFASPPVPFRGINYDGRTPMTVVVWEVKVGHGWFFNPRKAALRDLTLARWDAQKNLGMSVARRCGYSHLWSIPDRWLAGMLNTRWAGSPPVLALPK